MEMISPQRVVEMLKEHGTIVTEEEAKIILGFMCNFAAIGLSQILADATTNSTKNIDFL
jgi:hypothetical protein